jgi:hypothetical protein
MNRAARLGSMATEAGQQSPSNDRIAHHSPSSTIVTDASTSRVSGLCATPNRAGRRVTARSGRSSLKGHRLAPSGSSSN